MWEGPTPSGKLEDDRWVQAVRAGELAYATAVNAANFTDESMTESWEYRHVRWFTSLSRQRQAFGKAEVVLGPRPFVPLEVDVDRANGKTVVAGCVDPLPVVSQDPGHDQSDSSEWPRAQVWLLERFGHDSGLIVDVRPPHTDHRLPSGEMFTDDSCADITVPRMLFDPPPDLDDLLVYDATEVLLPPDPLRPFPRYQP